MSKFILSVLVLILQQNNLVKANGQQMKGIQINVYNPIVYMTNITLNNDDLISKVKGTIERSTQIKDASVETTQEKVLKLYKKIFRKGIKPRIVNGVSARINEFPYSVYVSISCYPDIDGACTGSIISNSLVLTAGHCVLGCKDAEYQEIDVYVGSEICVDGTRRKIKEYFEHEGLTTDEPPYVIKNDIAVLLLEKRLTFSEYIQPVMLSSQPVMPDVRCALAGWGSTDMVDVESSEILMYVNMTTWEQSRCVKEIQDLPPKTFCATGIMTKQHPFHGDSGAALVTIDNSQERTVYTQIGIHSLIDVDTYTCVLVDTSQYYDWIMDKIKKC